MTNNRIELINCNPEILDWIIEGDYVLAKNLKIKVPKDWTEFGTDIFKFSLDAIVKKPSSQVWWTYLAVDVEKKSLIGNCGFKGEPISGFVEIGYEVCKTFRYQGYATEMVNELLAMAFKSKKVKSVLAHTLAENNPSVGVLKKNGFTFVEGIFDEEDGNLWKWELVR